jgi:tetratricopeptide (TPR) repeat protein
VKFGNLLSRRERPAVALPWYERALALARPLHQQDPQDVFARSVSRDAHRGRAEALDDLKRHTEALADWDRAVELSPPADRPRVRLGRARSLALAGNAAEAVADTDALTKDPRTPGGLLYDAACVHALAAAAAEDCEQQAAWAGKALALLRRAQGAGYFKDRRRIEQLKNDADFNGLRPREDFRSFVAAVEAAAKP